MLISDAVGVADQGKGVVVNRKPIKRIAQRNWDHGDCGLACVAMVANVSYEEALDAFRMIAGKKAAEDFHTYHRDIEAMLSVLGRESKRIRFRSWHEIRHHAIVKVNLRKSGHWHWVVFDAARGFPAAHDPKPGKRKLIEDFRGLKGSGAYIALVD